MEKTDAVLVREAQQGERQSFAQLVNRFRSPIIGYVSGLFGSRDDAEEVAQEAFLLAWQKLRTLREPGNFSAWLFRIAGNLASKQMRRQSRVPTIALSSDQAACEPVAATETADPGHRSLRLLARLVELDDDYLEVVMRKHFSGLDGRTIARQLNIKPGTVRSRLSRAYAKLRELMNE